MYILKGLPIKNQNLYVCTIVTPAARSASAGLFDVVFIQPSKTQDSTCVKMMSLPSSSL